MNNQQAPILTDDEIKGVLLSIDPEARRLPPGWRDFARKIEALVAERAAAAERNRVADSSLEPCEGRPLAREEVIRMAKRAGFIAGTQDYLGGSGSMRFVRPLSSHDCLPEIERFAAIVNDEVRSRGEA